MGRKFIKFLTIIIIGISHFSCGGIPGYLIKESNLDPNPEIEEGNKYLKITSHIEGSSVNSFEETFIGNCDDSYLLTVTEISSSVRIISSSCTGTNLSITVGFKATYGSAEYRSFSVTNGEESLERTVSFRLDCPSAFIGVPGSNHIYEVTSDFCVSKYEMKLDKGSGIDATGNNPDTGWSVAWTAKSVAQGKPWVYINKTEAIDSCNALDGAFDYHLISNKEWQTIARNIESRPENWAEGALGGALQGNGGTNSNYLNHGHADDNPSQACEADSDDNNAYVEGACTGLTSEPGGFVEKRVHTLSNGEVIWDLAGNVYEWTSDDVNTGLTLTSGNVGDYAYLTTSGNTIGNAALFDGNGYEVKEVFGPLNDYSELNTAPYGGLGSHYIWQGDVDGAILRGGSRGSGLSLSGVFNAALGFGSSVSDHYIGFRCRAVPLTP